MFPARRSAVGHQPLHSAATGNVIFFFSLVSTKMGFLVCSILIFKESEQSP